MRLLNDTVDVGDSRLPHSSKEKRVDVYFSADVETDGPIPGPYSMLSIGIVYAGRFDGHKFERPLNYDTSYYAELKPISDQFQDEALQVNQLDRSRLILEGLDPKDAMTRAANWITSLAGTARPVLVAFPLSFDWSWLYWYFVRYSASGSPFEHSRCFDVKTAYAVKAHIPLSNAGRASLPTSLRTSLTHSHHALGDAIEQAEIFANIFEWEGERCR